MRQLTLCLPLILSLAACGGGGGGTATPGVPLPAGAEVKDGPFTTYRTSPGAGYDVGPQNRVLRNLALADQGSRAFSDAEVLAEFDTTGTGPAGYRNLMADVAGQYARSDMILEVIAEVGPGNKPNRLIRITADQSLLKNDQGGYAVSPDGEFFFRGHALSWVTIDNGPLLEGRHEQGLVNMSVNFAKQTANIELRSNSYAPSEVELTLIAKDLPFNVRTGAFGGDVTMQVGTTALGRSGDIAGQLRGNVGGDPVWTNGTHGLTTSGLFTGSDTVVFENGGAAAKPVVVDGIWFGRDEKLP